MWLDGVSQGTSALTIFNNIGGSGQSFKIGDWNNGVDYPFVGVQDEVRISNTARSAAWILTEYRNQSAPVTYLSAGPRITGDGGGSRVRHAVRGGV